MDVAAIRQHLRGAERHVADGEKRVARQRAVVAELERDNHDVRQAKELLVAFEQTQKIFVEDRDRIRQELLDAQKPESDDRTVRS